MYPVATEHGSIKVFDGDDGWVEFREWPAIAWVHLPDLKPYARNGKNWNAGDMRPEENIIRWANIRQDRTDAILDEFRDRERMFRAGYFPKNPDPIDCYLCESEQWCDRYDVAEIDNGTE